ncbi:hypothetical protein SAMN04489735_104523 [Aneurinibacillus thermoaerophilus]|uniref:Uncharacterized protein n=1 Tax=Aneurinibacillus thermoaerophilus TaxID=143495 RepID=A0A1G8EL04_ANETH|nr:hypothetical protein [Aneurinibacillus thermoaerophilus]SDH70540.1 hypothetical protein SAMN04489735_104523 [Aneurinibacillus thermoaerophilus]
MSPRFSDYLDKETQKQLNKMRQAGRKPVKERLKDDLPTVTIITNRQRERKEFERMMRGPAYTRRRGAIRQIRHSE